MGLNSGIEWTNHTWNPWYGCHKVSEGCRNCYMYRQAKQYGRDPNLVQRSKTTFRAPLNWAKKGERMMVFTCSWSDFFIGEAELWRDEAWEIIRNTPNLIYQILTKRPERIIQCLPEDWGQGWENVWLGVSIENKLTAYQRFPFFMEVPAITKFISFEPLIEDVDPVKCINAEDWAWDQVNFEEDDIEPEELIEECEAELDWINYGDNLVVNPEYKEWLSERRYRARYLTFKGMIDWVIVGGESGPAARPCHPDWVRHIRDLCISAEIPFFFKQWGEYMPLEPAPEMRSQHEGVKFMKVGRKEAGSLLDGREWKEFPKVEQ